MIPRMQLVATMLAALAGCSDEEVGAGAEVEIDVTPDIADIADIADVTSDVGRETIAPEPDVADTIGSEPDVAPADSAAPTPARCFHDATPGHHTVPCDDITFAVEVPEACVTSACGLVVDVHGWTMSADIEDANTRMRQRGHEHGLVVIQPTAPAIVGVPTWNHDRDAPRIFAFTAEVARVLGTDPTRAYVMGFSQGGAITWELVCAHADFFAAASPIGALPGCAFDDTEAPSEEVDMLVVHGTKDSVVGYALYEGQRDAALAHWSFGPATPIEADGMHRATRRVTAAGTVLETWEHDYASANLLLNGHCLPGSPETGVVPIQFGCQEPDTFVWAELALDFFLAHPRSAAHGR